jgi:glycerate kinase
LIAPNAYKNSLSARDAAEAIRAGLEQSGLSCSCECHPIADGGDGTGTLLIEWFGGSTIDLMVDDPFGRAITASYGYVMPGGHGMSEGRGMREEDGKPGEDPGSEGIAVIEMSAASGLRLLRTEELNPLMASSTGTGQLIAAALDKGARQILLAVGGTATVDGGIGILHALGARFINADGNVLPPVPGRLAELARIDLDGLHPKILDSKLTILCDVDNFLLGNNGSAAVFGPQKGASPAMVEQLDAALSHFRDIALATTGRDMAAVRYGGAAGGSAAGLYAILNAELVNGADQFLRLTDFDTRLDRSDMVITGEGSIDAQTLQGKGPFAVAQWARDRGIPAIGLAGKVPAVSDPRLQAFFQVLLAIGNGPTDLQEAIRSTGAGLTRTAAAVGALLALG